MKLPAILILLLAVHAAGHGQTSPADSVTWPATILRVNYDNDLFAGTDRYYTQGTYIDLSFRARQRTPSSRILALLGSEAGSNYYSVTVRQNVYTPRSIRHPMPVEGDRPYSAYLAAGLSSGSLSNNQEVHVLTGFSAGILGPAALGAETQKGIHSALDNIAPLGWEHQVRQDLLLQASLLLQKAFLQKSLFEVAGYTNLNAGTVFTDVAAGTRMRAGTRGISSPVRGWVPAGRSAQQRLYVHAVFRAELKAVVHNATLQGGISGTESLHVLPASGISRLTGAGEVGLVIGYRQVSLEFSRHYVTAEIRGGLDHGWGHCALMIGF